MIKLLCFLAVAGLAAAQTHTFTQIRTITVDSDSTAIGNLGNPTVFARAFVGESFTFTINGKGLADGDRIAWVKNADTDCNNAGGAQGSAAGVAAVTLDCNDAGTQCTSAATSVTLAQVGSSYDGYMKLCYQRQAYDAYGKALTGTAQYFPWQYYGTYFRFGITNFDSWGDGSTAESGNKYTVGVPQRFWATQKTGTGMVLSGQNIFDGDKIQAVPVSSTATATCAGVSYSTCAGGTNECTTIASKKFSSDISFTANSGTRYFLCYTRTTVSSRSYDTGLRANTWLWADNSLQFVFPYHVSVTTAAAFKDTSLALRVGMFAARSGDKFFLLASGVTSGNYKDDCSGLSSLATTDPFFSVTTIDIKNTNNVRTAKINFLSTTTSYKFSSATLSTMSQFVVCYKPEGTVSGTSGGYFAHTTISSRPWSSTYTNCDPGVAPGGAEAAITNPGNGLQFLMPNDFTFPGTANTVLLSGIANTVFFAGCVTANGYYGVSMNTCTNTPAAGETGLAKITDPTWPLISVTPVATAATTSYKLCGNGNAINVGNSGQISYNVIYSLAATGALTKGTAGTGDSFVPPSKLATKASDKSATWFMAGWQAFAGATLGSGLNYWSGDGNANKYNDGASSVSGTINTDVIFTTTNTDDFSCTVDAVNALRYKSTWSYGGKDGGSSPESWLSFSNVRTAAAITCTSGSNTACIIGTSNTPDVATKRTLTMCARVYDGTTHVSSWTKTAITITQYPQLFVFPTKLVAPASTATATPNYYIAGIDSKEGAVKIGVVDVAITGATTSPTTTAATSRCAVSASLGTVGSGKVAFPVAAAATTGQLNSGASTSNPWYFCIQRDADTDGYIFQKLGLTLNLLASAAASYIGPASYTITPATGSNAVAYSPASADKLDIVLGTAGSVTLTATFSTSDVGLDDTVAPKVSQTPTDCTNGANDVVTGTQSWTNTLVQADDGTLIATQGVTATFVFASSLTATTGAGSICWNKNVHGANSGGLGGIRILKVAATCTTNCDSQTPLSTNGFASAIKFDTYGNYFVYGTTPTPIVAFELTNGYSGETTTDKALFLPAASTSAADFTTNGQTVTVASNGPLAGTAIAGKATVAGTWTFANFFQGTYDKTGVYNLWIKGGRSTNTVGGYNSGRTAIVIQVTGRYPASFLASDGATIYFDNKGLTAGGQVFLYDANCPASTSDYSTISSGNKSNKVTLTVSAAGAASATFTAPAGTLPASTINYKAVCWQPASAAAGNFFLQVGTFASPYLNGYVAVQTSLSSDLPTAFAANMYTLEKQVFAFTVKLTSNTATGVGYVQDGTNAPLLIDSSKTCSGEVSGTNNAVVATSLKKNAETDNTVVTGSTVTFPSLTAGKATSYSVCWTPKKSPSVVGDWTDALASTLVYVRQMPSGLTTTSPTVLVANADAGTAQKVTLNYANANDHLDGASKDTLCLVPKGRAGPTTSAQAVAWVSGAFNSLTDATGTYSIYCAAPSSDVVDFTAILGAVTTGARGDYDLWVAAGAVSGSLAIPAQITGTITIVYPAFRPNAVFVSGAATNTRTFFTDIAGDSWTVSDTLANCATATTYAATTGSGNTISFTGVVGASPQVICFSPAKASTIKIGVRTSLTVRDATADTAIDTLKADTAFAPVTTTASEHYFYIQDNTDTSYTFPFATSAAQPGDLFKVIKYESAFPTSGSGKDCDAQSIAASDFYGDNTAAAGWVSPIDTAASVWVTIAKLPATSGATGSTNQNLPLCWAQKNGSSNNLKKVPGNTVGLGVRVVDVNTFHVYSGASATLNSYANAPRAVAAYTRTKVTFGGHWLDANDAVSFVPASAKDCSQAWYYENLLNGPTPSATTPTMISDPANFFTSFEGGLPGGPFYLCYLSWHTKTGYRFYSDLAITLRSIDASIMPLTASSGIPTTFALMTYGHDQLQYTYWRTGLPSTLVNANDKGQFALSTAACASTNVSNSVNFTADGKISATLTTTNPTDTFQPCVDFYSGPAQQAIACNVYGSTCGTMLGNYSPFVTVYSSAKVVTYRPATIPRGRPTDLVFHGSFLNKGGQDGVYLNTTASCNGTFTPLATGGVAAEQNQAVWPGYVQQVPGAYAACYQYFLNASTPVATGLNVIVAGVDSIAPTGVDAATFLAKTPITITLTGFFNQYQTNKLLDNDYVGLVPRVAAKRDCAGVNMTLASTNPIAFTGSSDTATSGTVATFDIADAPAAGDYSLCVHFAGMPWTGDNARDFVLIDQAKVTFSLRQVNQFLPRSIVNNTATVVSFFGFGLANDTVGWVASTADCTAAAPPTTSQASVVGGKATINVAAGSYRLCYKFKDSTAWFNVLTASDLLVAEAAVVKTLTVKVKGAAVPSKSWDMTDSARLVLAGTGLGAGDKARLVNYTNPLDCSVTTGWMPVAAEDPLNTANYYIDAPAGSIANGTYGLCYQWASGTKQGYNDTAFKVTVTNGPRLLGVAPRMVNLAASASFFIVGQALTASDKVSLVPAGTACPAAGTTQVSNVVIPLASRTVVNVSLAITGATGGATFNLCYYPAATPTVSQVINNAIWVNDPAVVCDSSKRYRCGVTCSNTPCPVQNADLCSNNPLAVVCPGTAFCARSADECYTVASPSGSSLPPCPAATPQRCFDGTCSLNLLTCPPVSPPPQMGVRCADGTNAGSPGACGATTKACAGITGTNTFCAAAGGCPVAGVSDLNQCPPADGCPVGQQRCSDCTCQTDCTSRSFPMFQCADGSRGTSRNDCLRCWRHSKFAQQTFNVRLTGRRRFVVRASAGFTSVPLMDNSGNTIVTYTIPAGLFKDDGCSVGIYSVAESVVDSAYADPSVGFLAGPTVYIGIMNNASQACNLDSTQWITFNFPQLETQTITCGIYIGNATVKAGANRGDCSVSGATLLGVGVAPYWGSAAPKTFVVPSATPSTPVPSTSNGPSTSASNVPSGSAVPSGSTASNPPSSDSSTSASIAVSASTLLVAVALSLLALLI